MAFKTEREFLNAVLSISENADIIAYATGKLAKLDERNVKRAATQTPAQKENEAMKSAIIKMLTLTPVPASVIANSLGTSSNKVSALCGQLAEQGLVNITPIKSATGRGKVNGYSLVMLPDPEPEVEPEAEPEAEPLA